jgi:5-methylcytosine-specific restriction endonuclease McrA
MDYAYDRVRDVPKPVHGRKAPKRGKASEFSTNVRKAIIKRDKGQCVRCSAPYHNIHHVIFRSQGGLGTEDNGVCVCYWCHEYAHSSREGRQWFEDYREEYLKRVSQ